MYWKYAPTSNHVYIVKTLKHTLYITCCWELYYFSNSFLCSMYQTPWQPSLKIKSLPSCFHKINLAYNQIPGLKFTSSILEGCIINISTCCWWRRKKKTLREKYPGLCVKLKCYLQLKNFPDRWMFSQKRKTLILKNVNNFWKRWKLTSERNVCALFWAPTCNKYSYTYNANLKIEKKQKC